MTGRGSPSATATDAQFEQELEAFYRQGAEAIQFLFAQLAINQVATRNGRTLRALNITPMFWNTVVGALQHAGIVALGRVFDNNSKHNVGRLIRLAEQNGHLFSKAALAARKRRMSNNADEWLPTYLSRVHVPTTTDFRRLRQFVKRHRAIFESQLKEIRHKHVAHTEVIDKAEISAIFAKARLTDQERLVVFLSKLYKALWEMFYNGRPPRLRPMPLSSRNLMRRRFDDPRKRTVQEAVVSEVRQCLRLLT